MNEDFSLTILNHNRDQLCRSARECVNSGMVNPVIVIADVRDGMGRQIAVGAGKMSSEQIEKMIREYAAKSTIPTLILGMPLESFRPVYEMMHRKPLALNPASSGKFYACVIADERTKITALPLPPDTTPSSN
jgi:hypothetical protein